MSEKKIHAYEIEETKDGFKLTDKASTNTFRILRNYIGKENKLIPSKPESWLTPSKDDLSDRYSIRMDYEIFKSEFLYNQNISEAPTDFFKQFSQRILTGSVKRKTKQKMMTFYQSPQEVTLDKTEVNKG